MPRERPPYRLFRSLGYGGYAEVFEAEARARPGARVAFKRPLEKPLAPERMAREIKVQRSLEHPHIMPILDAADDGSWFVMPLAEGNLEDLWNDGILGTDPLDVVREVAEVVSLGLEHAHDQGFVHRDVSPPNILALPDAAGRRWVVADWGLLRQPRGATTRHLTSSNEGLGTAGFAAPETWDDAHSADERADVYSLGRVLAWLLSGKRPRQNMALLPEGPLRGLIRESTDLNPKRRIESMAAFRARLHELLEPRPLSARAQVEELVDEAINSGEDVTARVVDLALDNADDDELYLDELARLPLDQVGHLAATSPPVAAEIAETLIEHLERRFGNRDFDYANVPLRWAFEVLSALTATEEWTLAEDVGAAFFRADKAWVRFAQKRITTSWLRKVTEREGVVVARALRRSGAQEYYQRDLEGDRIASRSVAAELGL